MAQDIESIHHSFFCQFNNKVVRDLVWSMGSSHVLREEPPDYESISKQSLNLNFHQKAPNRHGIPVLSDLWARRLLLHQETCAWLNQLNNDPLHLVEWLKGQSGIRKLGGYFGALVEYWIRFCPTLRVDDLVVGAQIKEGKTVIGALKYVFTHRAEWLYGPIDPTLLSDLRGVKVCDLVISADGKKPNSDLPDSQPHVVQASSAECAAFHWEASMKCFACVPEGAAEGAGAPRGRGERGAEGEGAREGVLGGGGGGGPLAPLYIGPFLHESMIGRINIIKKKLILPQAEPVQKWLQKKFDNSVISKSFLRGYILYPLEIFSAQCNVGFVKQFQKKNDKFYKSHTDDDLLLSPRHHRGWWCQDIEKLIPRCGGAASRWAVLPKQHWLSPAIAEPVRSDNGGGGCWKEPPREEGGGRGGGEEGWGGEREGQGRKGPLPGGGGGGGSGGGGGGGERYEIRGEERLGISSIPVWTTKELVDFVQSWKGDVEPIMIVQLEPLGPSVLCEVSRGFLLPKTWEPLVHQPVKYQSGAEDFDLEKLQVESEAAERWRADPQGQMFGPGAGPAGGFGGGGPGSAAAAAAALAAVAEQLGRPGADAPERKAAVAAALRSGGVPGPAAAAALRTLLLPPPLGEKEEKREERLAGSWEGSGGGGSWGGDPRAAAHLLLDAYTWLAQDLRRQAQRHGCEPPDPARLHGGATAAATLGDAFRAMVHGAGQSCGPRLIKVLLKAVKCFDLTLRLASAGPEEGEGEGGNGAAAAAAAAAGPGCSCGRRQRAAAARGAAGGGAKKKKGGEGGEGLELEGLCARDLVGFCERNTASDAPACIELLCFFGVSICHGLAEQLLLEATKDDVFPSAERLVDHQQCKSLKALFVEKLLDQNNLKYVRKMARKYQITIPSLGIYEGSIINGGGRKIPLSRRDPSSNIDSGTVQQQVFDYLKLPAKPKCGAEKTVVFVNERAQLDQLRKQISELEASVMPLIGMDCEWRPSQYCEAGETRCQDCTITDGLSVCSDCKYVQPVSLVQLALHEGSVFIIDMLALCFPQVSAVNSMSTCSQQQAQLSEETFGLLKLIIASKKLVLAGFGLHGDLSKLCSSYPPLEPSILKACRILEIQMLALKFLPTVGMLNKLGLADVCRIVLSKDLDKEQQTSDWSIRPLSTAQLEYAALDAYSALRLALAFETQYAAPALLAEMEGTASEEEARPPPPPPPSPPLAVERAGLLLPYSDGSGGGVPFPPSGGPRPLPPPPIVSEALGTYHVQCCLRGLGLDPTLWSYQGGGGEEEQGPGGAGGWVPFAPAIPEDHPPLPTSEASAEGAQGDGAPVEPGPPQGAQVAKTVLFWVRRGPCWSALPPPPPAAAGGARGGSGMGVRTAGSGVEAVACVLGLEDEVCLDKLSAALGCGAEVELVPAAALVPNFGHPRGGLGPVGLRPHPHTRAALAAACPAGCAAAAAAAAAVTGSLRGQPPPLAPSSGSPPPCSGGGGGGVAVLVAAGLRAGGKGDDAPLLLGAGAPGVSFAARPSALLGAAPLGAVEADITAD